MKRGIFAAITVILLCAISTATIETTNFETIQKKQVSAVAYVHYPNFDVLHETQSNTITLIKDIETPESYEGILLRMHDFDFSQLQIVIKNLEIQNMHVHSTDSELIMALENANLQFSLI